MNRKEELQTTVTFEQTWEAYMKRKNKEGTLRSKRANRWVIGVAASGLILAGASIALQGSSALAAILEKIPFLSSYYEQQGIIHDRGWEEVDKLGLASTLNASEEDQGITLTMTDVFYDGVRLAIGYDLALQEGVQFEEAGGQIPLMVESSFKGIDIDFIMTDGSNEKIEDRLYRGAITINTSSLPNAFTLGLKVTNIGGQEGLWKFSLPVQKSVAPTEFHPNATATYQDFDIKISKVLVSPVSTEVLVEATGPKGTWDQLNFSVKDDWGTGLEFAGGGGENFIEDAGSGKETLTHRLIFGPLGPVNTRPEYLILQPRLYTVFHPEDLVQTEVVKEMDGVFPMEFGGGKLTILGIDFMENKTLVRYEVGSLENQYPLLFIQDEAGTDYTQSKWPQRMKKEPYEFQAEYPRLDASMDLKVRVILEEYKNQAAPAGEIVVPLQWE